MNRLLVVVVGAALLSVACDEKKTTNDTPRIDAGTDKYATADPKLEKALKAVASAPAASDNGPPPTGIFAPGIADQRHARGVPTKLDVLDAGTEPRVTLTPTGAAAQYGPAVLQMAMQLGPRSVVAIDYLLSLGPAKKDEGGGDWLVADVKRASPSKAMGPLPAGAEKDFAALEGTQLRLQLTADGRESEIETRLAKGAKSDLDQLARSAAESLVFSTVPFPQKPVGVGARWIAENRMPLSGLDVIAYRAYQIKSLDGDRLQITLETKAYAASKDVQLAGVPKGATLEQFEATGHGELQLVRGETLARKSEVQHQYVMMFSAPGAEKAPGPAGQPSGNRLTAQLQSQATLIRGEDLRAAARQP